MARKLTTDAPAGQRYVIQSDNQSDLSVILAEDSASSAPTLVAFTVNIPEVSSFGFVTVTTIVPYLIGRTYSALDVLWPASGGPPGPIALLDVSVSDAPTGEVIVQFLAEADVPHNAVPLTLLVYP